jgi:hypothetical protein
MAEEKFEGWCILELMGRRKMAGKVSEASLGGGAFLRIDVPGEGSNVATQFYSPSAVYCITPTTEEIARQVAPRWQPAPVTRWELPAPVRPEPEDAAIEDNDPGF